MVEPIRVRDLTKTYGDVVALSSVDLTVEPGTVHGLVGPNGSGKTTLLDVLLELTPPTAGTVSVPDVPVGCSFQSPNFYSGLTVAENLEVFRRMVGYQDDAREQRLWDVFDLHRVSSQLAGNLSGGWQKKLDLALAVRKQPTYLLLDEPFNELDDASLGRLQTFLADYRDTDRAILVVTHQADTLDEIVDRLTVLERGSVRYDGAVDPDSSVSEQYLRHIELE